MKIHWIGGNLPASGKAWLVRGLTESIYLERGIQAVVVDTSINAKLTTVYNPGLLATNSPSDYFTRAGVDSCLPDQIYELAGRSDLVIVKLASYSQQLFLEWVDSSGILKEEIEHEFWFVSNGQRDSFEYFPAICNRPWQTHFVKNMYARSWQTKPSNGSTIFEDEDGNNHFDVRILPATITNPAEIEEIESRGATLYHLAHPQNKSLPMLTRTRIKRFLQQSCQNLLTLTPPPAVDRANVKLALCAPAIDLGAEDSTPEPIPF
jgi:hypothetical protein